jgi:hypothetical protein
VIVLDRVIDLGFVSVRLVVLLIVCVCVVVAVARFVLLALIDSVRVSDTDSD